MIYVLASVACLLIILHIYLKSNYDYWKKRNVPYAPPVSFFGNLRDAMFMKKSLGQVYTDMYNTFKNIPYVGFYKIRQPALMIRDPDIIRDILIKDFHYFEKNDVTVDEKVDPITAKNPFVQTGQQWKTSRSQLSYCFTAGKLKHLFPLMHEVSNTMTKYLEKECDIGNNPIDTKELASKFTTDNVATSAFGLEGKSFEDPDAEFRKVGRQFLQPSLSLQIKFLIIFLFPIWTKIFSIKFIPESAASYFRSIIRSTLKYRKENNIVRNDFLDTITQMKLKPGEPALTHEDITGHALSIFGDGFETSSIALTFTLYELAANLDVQQKLRNEIEGVTKKYGGTVNYEAIQDMDYLDCVISESLRLHPPGLFMTKICTADYILPPGTQTGREVKIEANTPIVISIYGLHYDPNYFPNPEKFDPDRFSEINKSQIIKGTYLSFGDGPRICVGMKFALLQVKIALVAILKNFDISVNRKTREPIEIDPRSVLLTAKGGIWLDYRKRNT